MTLAYYSQSLPEGTVIWYRGTYPHWAVPPPESTITKLVRNKNILPILFIWWNPSHPSWFLQASLQENMTLSPPNWTGPPSSVSASSQSTLCMRYCITASLLIILLQGGRESSRVRQCLIYLHSHRLDIYLLDD